MKARPRSVENKVADYLSDIFVPAGFARIERIPILGRTGPDMTINESGLVIDAKSRAQVPATIFMPIACAFSFEEFIGVPLRYARFLFKGDTLIAPTTFHSILVRRWWQHMDEWTQINRPDGVSAIVLHRPTEPIGSCVLVIHSADLRRLQDKCQTL